MLSPVDSDFGWVRFDDDGAAKSLDVLLNVTAIGCLLCQV
jgi:hypothetical protein